MFSRAWFPWTREGEDARVGQHEEVAHARRAGDVIAIPGSRVGDQGRVGEVLEARGKDGAPPYLVRWEDGTRSSATPGRRPGCSTTASSP